MVLNKPTIPVQNKSFFISNSFLSYWFFFIYLLLFIYLYARFFIMSLSFIYLCIGLFRFLTMQGVAELFRIDIIS